MKHIGKYTLLINNSSSYGDRNMKLCESVQPDYFKEPFLMENNISRIEHKVRFD